MLPPIAIRTGLFEWRAINRSTSFSIVAEKNRLWRDFGRADRIFSIAGRKPISSMRSASSSTTVDTVRRSISLRFRKSSRRPGVAITICTPRRMALSCVCSLSPPTTTAARRPVFGDNLLKAIGNLNREFASRAQN